MRLTDEESNTLVRKLAFQALLRLKSLDGTYTVEEAEQFGFLTDDFTEKELQYIDAIRHDAIEPPDDTAK